MDKINAWNFINVNSIGRLALTNILNQSGYGGMKLDDACFSHINSSGKAVFNIEFWDDHAGLPGEGLVYVEIQPNGDFSADF